MEDDDELIVEQIGSALVVTVSRGHSEPLAFELTKSEAERLAGALMQGERHGIDQPQAQGS